DGIDAMAGAVVHVHAQQARGREHQHGHVATDLRAVEGRLRVDEVGLDLLVADGVAENMVGEGRVVPGALDGLRQGHRHAGYCRTACAAWRASSAPEWTIREAPYDQNWSVHGRVRRADR